MTSSFKLLRDKIKDASIAMTIRRFILPTYGQWQDIVESAVSYDPANDGPEVEILRRKNA